MNSCIALLVALVAVASAATLREESLAQAASCAEKFSISPEVFAQLAVKPSEVEATENVKCFTKCVSDSAELFTKDQVLDVEKLVRISVANGHKESDARTSTEKCKSLIKLNGTCDEAWASVKCINGF